MNQIIENYEEPVGQFDELDNANEVDTDYDPPTKIKIICSYLYFIQGVILSLPNTMPLIYDELPSYSILSLFSAAMFPFSIKFLFAPFAEKFSIISYGKRKTWIIMSQIFSSLMLFVGSFLLSEDHIVKLAWLFIITVAFVTMQDISLDAMAIKQMKVPFLVGRTQTIMQTAGVIIGSLLFLKGTSLQFAKSIGYQAPLFSPEILLRFFSLVILVPTIAIHYLYKETILDSQRKSLKKSLLSIIKSCKIFVTSKSRYCRIALLFMGLNQGFHFFTAGYEYQLINGGFSKNTINTINNISLIPVSFIIIGISEKITTKKWSDFMLGQMIIRWVFYLLLIIIFPNIKDQSKEEIGQHLFFNRWFVTVSVSIIQLLDLLNFLLGSIMVNSFPVVGLSGLFITVLNSCFNFGNLKTIHLKIIGAIGWSQSATIGLIVQLAIMFMLKKWHRISMEGSVCQTDIDTSSSDEELKQETANKYEASNQQGVINNLNREVSV